MFNFSKHQQIQANGSTPRSSKDALLGWSRSDLSTVIWADDPRVIVTQEMLLKKGILPKTTQLVAVWNLKVGELLKKLTVGKGKRIRSVMTIGYHGQSLSAFVSLASSSSSSLSWKCQRTGNRGRVFALFATVWTQSMLRHTWGRVAELKC